MAHASLQPFPAMPAVQVFQPQNRILSASDAPDLLYWISSLIDSGVTILAIDMSLVSFMDSSGLGSLVIAHNRVQKAGGKLVLCSISGQARMLFEMSGFHEMFEIYDSVQDLKDSSPQNVHSPEGD
jgi:anti-anti-sigma factor